jgi:hypothetical protein
LGYLDLISLSSCDFCADQCSRRYGLVEGLQGIVLYFVLLLFDLDKIWYERLLNNSVDRFIVWRKSAQAKDETESG